MGLLRTSIGASVAMLCLLPHAIIAQEIKFGAPPGKEILQKINASTDREDLIKAHRQSFPVFVFIPGIMGSKLIKTDKGKSVVVFGEWKALGPTNPIMYTEDDKGIIPSLLDEFTIDYSLGKKKYDVYGTAIKQITALSSEYGSNILVYPYDWRQSNVKTAIQFSEWLCRASEKIDGRPVMFIAHSMGGLVLKHWLMTEYRRVEQEAPACRALGKPFPTWINIKRIVFLGTPHYGAPQAAYAFATGYHLLYKPLAAREWWTWQWVAKLTRVKLLDREWLSRALNLFGATFPSGYQLLPITGMSCFSAESPAPIQIKVETTKENVESKLFESQTWASFGLPTYIDEALKRAGFHRQKLPGHLEDARKFLCALADYDVDQHFDVVRFYSRRVPTICGITITGSPEKRGFRPEPCVDGGDGTVPTWVATEARRKRPERTRELEKAEHVSLAQGQEFLEYLRDSFNEFHAAFQKSFVDAAGTDTVEQKRRQSTLVQLYASLGHFIPPTSKDPQASGIASDTNKGVQAQLGVTQEAIYKTAKKTPIRTAREDGLRVFTEFSQEQYSSRPVGAVGTGEDSRHPWALTRAADIALQKNDFVEALALARRALVAADALNSPVARTIKGLAAHTAAIAAFKLEDKQAAREYRQVAMDNGNSKARSNKLFTNFE
jgi:Lecithin:cholesterol acyltransferase